MSRTEANKRARSMRAATGPKRPRRPFATAAALTTLALSVSIPAVRAQTAAPTNTGPTATTPQSAEEASKKLDRQQHELEAKELRDRELQKDLATLSDDRREINARLVETAARVQASEEKMTAVEERLAGFERQEKTLRESLAKEHGKISGLLAALQRMGRNPPPVIITRREDALRMVRSAMLIGVAFPGLRDEAKALSTKLTDLVSIMTRIRRDGETLRAEREKFNAVQAQLASLLETKKQTLAERQTELRQVREAAAEISKNVSDLSELISKLSQQVDTAPSMPQVEREGRDQVVAVLPPTVAAQPAPAEPIPSDPAINAVARDAAVSLPPAAATPPEKAEEVALLSPGTPAAAPEPPSSSIVELAPTATSLMPGNPDRIRPAIAFHEARGKLSLPARGRRVLGFGEKTQYGGTSKGLVIETRYSARVTSPCDGWVVYAGEFRSYGQLLIINAGGGYHVLVAGLSRMDVGPGQFVLAAEPIGTMSGAPRTAQLATENTEISQSAPHSSAPVLYIEFRKDGQPIDSNPWWAASHQKVQD